MNRINLSIALLAVTAFAKPSAADPCGMVPPIWEGQGQAIQRVGPQKTYAFFKDGVETFVIRPGFRGRVDNFGMLIPFPAVPAMRKVSESTFQQLAAAIDPPEVVVDLRPMRYENEMLMDDMVPSSPAPAEEQSLRIDEVKVLKKEAVGMYEIAVLAAGSAKALERWMKDHDFVYPKGMDGAVGDYVKDKWCFVAVKTRVGVKSKVDPSPGMRGADPSLPPGGGFDGHVQAMGFRFKVKEPVIPMRLSTFNDGELRNIVYLLSDKPVTLSGIDKRAVRRQLKGQELYENVTELLPLRIYGGMLSDIPTNQLKSLEPVRRPEPHNAIARDLFAADLLAAKSGTLSHDFEEREKQLLNINERLNLRGAGIDRILEEELKKRREEAVLSSLKSVRSMTLTVVDGDFPREYLAKNNLRFERFDMPGHLNARFQYEAVRMGPTGKMSGVRVDAKGRTEGADENPIIEFWRGLWD